MKKEKIEDLLKKGPLKFEEVIFIPATKKLNLANQPLYYFKALLGIGRIVEFPKHCIRF